MSIGHLWMITDAGNRDHLRQANEARAAAFYAAFTALARAVYAPLGWLAASLRRSIEARATYRALSSLTDHQLKDIGIGRHEIASIADVVATQAPEVDVALADLRQICSDASIGSAEPLRQKRRLDEQPGRVPTRTAHRRGPAEQARPDQAA